MHFMFLNRMLPQQNIMSPENNELNEFRCSLKKLMQHDNIHEQCCRPANCWKKTKLTLDRAIFPNHRFRSCKSGRRFLGTFSEEKETIGRIFAQSTGNHFERGLQYKSWLLRQTRPKPISLLPIYQPIMTNRYKLLSAYRKYYPAKIQVFIHVSRKFTLTPVIW